MSKIYSVVWSDTRQSYVVASEHAATRGKPSSTVKRVVSALAGALIAQAAYAAPAPNALPTGGQVVAGQAAISQSGSAMTIQQSSQQTILNWQSFNIGSQASVNFQQPTANAVALNRVVGSDPSAIYGSLTANGQVFLVNPNGVLFGQGARVNVGGLVAATLAIRNEDFLAGNNLFMRNGATGSVVNQGTIDAKYVAMLAPEVRNEGVIAAQMGTVALAAGDAVTLGITGNNLIDVQVDKASINTLVENKQLVKAEGGTVIMSAQSANQLLGQVVNTGNIEANGISGSGGTIRLLASNTIDDAGSISANAGTSGTGGRISLIAAGGAVRTSGTINASNGDTGGTIQVTGTRVTVASGSILDASGRSGGGEILIGGDYQGKNAAIQNAVSTTVEQGASIHADAVERGNGGKLVVWSDGQTVYQGTASARGGASGGDGGNAEVSGKQRLTYQGTVDLRAPNGKTGNLLLDPTDVTITDAGAPTGSIAVAGNTSTIQTTDLANALALANVTISTTSGGGGNGDIIVAQGAGAYTFFLTPHDLTLAADRDIIVNESLNLTDPITQPSLALIAGRNLTINNPGGTTAVTTTKNFLLIADAAQNGTGPGTMILASGLSLGGLGVNRLFAPNSGAMQGLSSGSFSFTDPTTNVVTGKWVGDTGTSATGIYYKSATSPLTSSQTQVAATLITAEDTRISNLLADRNFTTWVQYLGLYYGPLWNEMDDVLSLQSRAKAMPALFSGELRAAFEKLETHLPDIDGHELARADKVERINDPEMNEWMKNIYSLEMWIVQHGRDDNTLASIAQLKKKIDDKLGKY